jgi:hypothetical protein
MHDELYPSLLRVRLPREMDEAIGTTARARFCTKSELVRQMLIEALKGDGAVLAPVAFAQNLNVG